MEGKERCLKRVDAIIQALVAEGPGEQRPEDDTPFVLEQVMRLGLVVVCFESSTGDRER